MRKNKFAIASFVLSFMPIIISFLLLLWTLVTFPGTPIQTVEPLEIVDGEIVGGEMKNSCVISNKIATRILKDGDMVEVDADVGVVKILKRI